MFDLDWIWERRNRGVVLLASILIVVAIAIVDWWTEPYLSLGFLYLFPIMLAAGFLPRWAVALLGAGCGALSEAFGLPGRSFTRLAFQMLALAACGLFVGELVRNRRISQ